MDHKPIPKRIGAFLLCFALLAGLLPTTALAAETPTVNLLIDPSSKAYNNTVNMMVSIQNLGQDVSSVDISLYKGNDQNASSFMNITEYPYNGACNHIFSIDLNNSDWKPDTYFITAKVTISGTTYSSDAVTLKVTKANQSLSAPTASEVSPD